MPHQIFYKDDGMQKISPSPGSNPQHSWMLDKTLPCSVTATPPPLVTPTPFETLEVLRISDMYLALLMTGYVPLGSSPPRIWLVYQQHHGEEAASLWSIFRLQLSSQGSQPPSPKSGASSCPWCLPWRPYKAIVYTGVHGSGYPSDKQTPGN